MLVNRNVRRCYHGKIIYVKILLADPSRSRRSGRIDRAGRPFTSPWFPDKSTVRFRAPGANQTEEESFEVKATLPDDAFEAIGEEVAEIERLITELERADRSDVAELDRLRERLDRLRASVPSAMDRVRLARHSDRPYTLDYVERLFTDFFELHGDRKYGDDPAIVCGLARFRGERVAVIGHQKGRTTRDRQHRNFGMPKPEGYRKALRVMKLAEKFALPVFTFIDTPGAYPGIDAEERGQAEAIAFNLREMSALRVPVICTVTGEGGSGGALAIGIGDWVQMLENAVYSVITPEGCAAILWKDASQAPKAAAALRITAHDLMGLGLIDGIVEEPAGGAHEDYDRAASLLGDALAAALAGVREVSPDERLARRYEKFRRMGSFEE
jgi:acetyl-CoA carboxylase carboxyl transferase subunit alpha